MKHAYQQPFELTPAADAERFESGAREYADYLRTVEGRLRLDLAWENFRSAFAENDPGPDAATIRGALAPALDLGCGTGALAVRLAREGRRVCAADTSAAMLEIAAEAARRERCDDRIDFYRLEAGRAAEVFDARSFGAVVCHNVLEYVSDPGAVARAAGRLLRPGGVASFLARNRAGEALRDAVKLHDLDSAARALTADSVRESLYGGPARLFDAESLNALAVEAGLEIVAVRGVRVVADYLPASLSETDELYARLLAFELRLGSNADFVPVARYVQMIARAPAR